MNNFFFEQLEILPKGNKIQLQRVLQQLQFNDQGLIPVIAQQRATSEVLMLAWMNREALEQTLSTGQMCYWSRSRQKLWFKGESSGHTQALIELRIDCDGDSLLCVVDQKGPACHTNRTSCFYLSVKSEEVVVTLNPTE